MAAIRFTRRRTLQLAGTAGAVVAVQACGNSVGSGLASDGSVKVGLIIPQAGVYAPLGIDMQRAWDLWLERHNGKFGGYTVQTVVADEGETRRRVSRRPSVLVGIVNSSTAPGVRDMVH